LEMIARSVDAPDHHLVREHELPYQQSTGYFHRARTTGNSGEHIEAARRERVEKIEDELRHARRLEDQLHLADRVVDSRRRDLAPIDIMSADADKPACTHARFVHDVETVDVGAAKPQRERAEKSDRSEARHQAAACVQPVRRVRDIRQPGALQSECLVDRLFRNRERLAQYAQRFEFLRYPDNVLLAIHDALGLIAVETPDSALA